MIQKKCTKLTHVAFNPLHPVMVIGDDRWTIICVKLSPNLYKALKVGLASYPSWRRSPGTRLG